MVTIGIMLECVFRVSETSRIIMNRLSGASRIVMNQALWRLQQHSAVTGLEVAGMIDFSYGA